MRRRAVLGVIAVALVACDPPRPAAARGPRADAARPADARALAAPSFRRELLPVLVRHCAAMPDCHGARPTDSVALDLRAPAAYGELVGRPSLVRRGALRVAPGDPGASFLVDKIAGPLRPREGKRMPLDADTGAPVDPNPLDGAFLAALRAWIAAGAPDN